jgi:hypothetical protein
MVTCHQFYYIVIDNHFHVKKGKGAVQWERSVWGAIRGDVPDKKG